MSKYPLCLLIDDEPDVLAVLTMLFETMDIVCHTAIDIKTAIQLLNTHSFDLCMTDVILPDGNGIGQLVVYIKEHHPQLPVIVFSASATCEKQRDELKAKSLNAGACEFISKPIDHKELRDIVKKVLKLSS